MDFRQLQVKQAAWQNYNFPHSTEYDMFRGIVEELGEISHAMLKADQGIRGTTEELKAEEMDAIGDLVIFLAGLCTKRGLSLQKCVETAWFEVEQRDWIKYPLNGISQ